jgi:addiction module HigA family antidote
MEMAKRERLKTFTLATLAEEFLKPFEIPLYRLATEIRVPVTRIAKILHGRRAVTAGTALRLAP